MSGKNKKKNKSKGAVAVKTVNNKSGVLNLIKDDTVKKKSHSKEPSVNFHNYKKGYYSSLGYRSVTANQIEGRPLQSGSGDRMMEFDRLKLVKQSRDFIRNNSIYDGMIERASSYICGNGANLQVKTKSKSFNENVERLWDEYWSNPEIKGLSTGSEIESMVCKEILTCGDLGVILTNSGHIQLIEAEQIQGKNMNERGIDTDDFGKPVRYWVSPYGKRGQIDQNAAQGVSPENFLFISKPKRPSDIRSVPPAQSAFPMLHRINDVADSEAAAWQIISRMAIAIIRKEGSAAVGFRDDPDRDATQDEGDAATNITDVDYALIFHGKEGEEIKGIERNIPGQNFTESMTMFLRLLGLPLGLPLEVVVMDWTKSNYSQSRAVLEQANVTFEKWQNVIRDKFLNPVFKWKLSQWISEGLVSDRKDKFDIDWILPAFPWIDQLKEAEAHGLKVDRGFMTYGQTLKTLNQDIVDVRKQREMEIREAIKIARDIEEDTGESVPYEFFTGNEIPFSQTVAQQEKIGDQTGTRSTGGNINPTEESEDEELQDDS